MTDHLPPAPGDDRLSDLLRRSLGRRQLLLGSAGAVATALLAACGQAPAPAAGPTAALPDPTAAPAPPTSAPAASGGSQRGGRALIALIQEPGQLNQFFTTQSGAQLSTLAVEPLFLPRADGSYEPLLAAEVPSVANGGISADSRTITYRLREGVTWSDGTPFTAEDVAFTYEVYRDPGSTPQLGPAYALIEAVRVVDPLTIEVQMSGINPGYLDLWKAVLPKHMFESTAVTQEHPQARLPLGTGPFIFGEWRTGDQITLERNPRYWRNPEQPYLDGITIRVTPERTASLASFIAGEFDTLFFVVTGDLATLKQAQEGGQPLTLGLQEGPSWVEWLWLNHSAEGDPATPHPVLGDPAVREAMDYGIDRQSIIDQVLGGFGYIVNSFLYAGWAATEIEPTPYDPARAAEILDAAGWAPGSDGIREKGGVRASLRFQTIANDQTRELYQQIVQQNMRDIGIELRIENVPSNTIFGSWEEGGIYARGEYDILMSRDGYYIDPTEWAGGFTTAQIPTAETPGGNNLRYQNPEFDALVQRASETLDQAARAEAYAEAARIFARDRVALPLYSSAWGWAWSSRLQGVQTDYWDGMWPSAASWTIAG